MGARKRLFGASVGQVFLVILLVTQAVMMVNTCVFPMPDCRNACPTGPCDGLSEHACRTAYVQADQAPGSDGIGILGFHPMVALAGLVVAGMLNRPGNLVRLRIALAARPPTRIIFCRMLK